MVEEARLEQQEAGLTPVTDGWFVVNVRDGAWVGVRCAVQVQHPRGRRGYGGIGAEFVISALLVTWFVVIWYVVPLTARERGQH